jgi:hypothetical protein
VLDVDPEAEELGELLGDAARLVTTASAVRLVRVDRESAVRAVALHERLRAATASSGSAIRQQNRTRQAMAMAIVFSFLSRGLEGTFAAGIRSPGGVQPLVTIARRVLKTA